MAYGKWHPISTAPREGEEVLLAFGRGFDAAPPLVAWFVEGGPGWCIAGTDLVIGASPTHWMQLPPPPAQA